MDHELRTCINKSTGSDLLNLPAIVKKTIKLPPVFGPEDHKALTKLKKSVIDDISNLFPTTCSHLNDTSSSGYILPLAAVHTCIESLISAQKLKKMDTEFKDSYADLFPSDIPHVSKLLVDVEMSIKLHNLQ